MAVRGARFRGLRATLARGLALAGLLCGLAGAQNFHFVDVTAEVGLDRRLGPDRPSIAVGDFDGDGWLDVALAGGLDPRVQLFQNLVGEGHGFVDVSEQRLPALRTPASQALFADLDGDGDQDLVVVRRHQTAGGIWSANQTCMTWYENRRGDFVQPDGHPDLGYHGKPPGGLTLADLDGDADLDVIFTHSGGTGLTTGSPGFYLQNDGALGFVDVTAQLAPSLSTPRRYFTPVLADYTGDLQPDLHVAVDLFPDFHCRNAGGGMLNDVSTAAGTTNGGADMGIAVGDIENDGDLDLFSTNIATGVLYVNDGAGKFTNEAQARGVGAWFGPLCVGWGTVFADFDHDMDQDLVCVGVTNPGFFWRNKGVGTGNFNMVPDHGLDLYGYGLVPFDYDRDGDVDLLVSDESPQKTPHLFENRSDLLAGRHWLVVELEGTGSNRDGVGAFVRVTAGGVTQTRTIVAGYSYRAGPPLDAHFGLGDQTVADVIEVTWPTGAVQTLTDVEVDRYLTIVEP